MAAMQRKPKYVVTIGNYPEKHSNNNLAKFVSRRFHLVSYRPSVVYNICGNDLMNSASTHLFRIGFWIMRGQVPLFYLHKFYNREK